MRRGKREKGKEGSGGKGMGGEERGGEKNCRQTVNDNHPPLKDPLVEKLYCAMEMYN